MDSKTFTPSLLGSSLSNPLGEMLARGDSQSAELVHRAQLGDKNAFASLVKAHQRVIYGLCVRLLRSTTEASDVAQETFLRAYEHLHRYDSSRPFEVWVLAIARNLCLDILRRKSLASVEDVSKHIDYLPSGATNAETAFIQQQEFQSLEAALSTLSASDREVLTLYYTQRRTTKEIAEILNVAPGTIMARLFRAREKLRHRLQKSDKIDNVIDVTPEDDDSNPGAI